MLEELAVAGTEIIVSRIAVDIAHKTILWALAVAGKQKSALTALARKSSGLQFSEVALTVAVHQARERLLAYVAQTIFGIDKVVARIDIAVKLHHGGMATFA